VVDWYSFIGSIFMAKKTTMFVCNACGYDSAKWYGKCPECQGWSTFAEIKVESEPKGSKPNTVTKVEKVLKISDIAGSTKIRIPTGFEEFNRVLGGGMVPGEVMLLSGDPGIGKSTILLQVALHIAAQKGQTVLYVTGEESEDQVKMRAERIVDAKNLAVSNLFILASSDIDGIAKLIQSQKPSLVIVDSIQTMASQQLPGFPGSVPQIRYCTQALVEVAKYHSIPTILVGHVTKEGIVAGPMVLSHMVDAVLYLEGEPFSGTRILRAFKNRFGDVSEVGIFVMEEKGLVEITNISEFFLEKKDETVPGSCGAVIIEGSRPILVELQALVVPTALSFPRRVVNGVQAQRVELLLAVIQKHARVDLSRFDVYINVVGGLKVGETASDLAVALAIVSSFKNKPLGKTAAIAEVGLQGELRHIVQLEKRIKEAQKFGYDHIISPKGFKTIANVVQSIV
jgi:DNA repair protein RadA/Sms